MWLVVCGGVIKELTQCKALVLSPYSLPSTYNFVDYFFGEHLYFLVLVLS